MYYPVRNPYGQQRSNSSCCCLTFLITFLAISTVAGLYFISQHLNIFAFELLRNPEIVAAFNEFMQEYGKEYSTMEETSYRYKVFANNYKIINEFNANPEKTSSVAINKFADLTDEEFEKLYLSKTIAIGSKEEDYIPSTTDLDVDWKEKVTPVKDQAMCGSCWTFSSISVVETLIAIKNNSDPVPLSEQELVDCCTGANCTRSNGCHGGEDEEALDYITKYGITKEADYPYHALDEPCKSASLPHVKEIKGQRPITTGEDMEKAINEQTIAVAIAAGHVAFRFYEKGVVSQGCPGDIISHAVTVVGAKTDSETKLPYWSVRNSWGENWGAKGYIKLMRSNTRCGLCGINCYSRVPIYKTP